MILQRLALWTSHVLFLAMPLIAQLRNRSLSGAYYVRQLADMGEICMNTKELDLNRAPESGLRDEGSSFVESLRMQLGTGESR